MVLVGLDPKRIPMINRGDLMETKKSHLKLMHNNKPQQNIPMMVALHPQRLVLNLTFLLPSNKNYNLLLLKRIVHLLMQ